MIGLKYNFKTLQPTGDGKTGSGGRLLFSISQLTRNLQAYAKFTRAGLERCEFTRMHRRGMGSKSTTADWKRVASSLRISNGQENTGTSCRLGRAGGPKKPGC
jgi:hypothetical protein